MKIYWSTKSVPELADLPKKDRMKIWRQCYLNVFQNWQTWLAIVVCGACGALGRILGEIWGIPKIGFVIACILGIFILQQVTIRMTIPHIREYLKSHDQVCHY